MKFDSGTGWPSFFTTLPGALRDQDRLQADRAAHRVPLRALRRPPRPRLRRRPGADRQALLQQRRGAEVRAGGGVGLRLDRWSAIGGKPGPGTRRRATSAVRPACRGPDCPALLGQAARRATRSAQRRGLRPDGHPTTASRPTDRDRAGGQSLCLDSCPWPTRFARPMPRPTQRNRTRRIPGSARGADLSHG